MGEVIKSESPDFVIIGNGLLTGVEITRVLNQKRSGEKYSPIEQYSLENKLAKLSEKIFKKKYRMSLTVNLHFQGSSHYSSRRKKWLPYEIAELVWLEVQKW